MARRTTMTTHRSRARATALTMAVAVSMVMADTTIAPSIPPARSEVAIGDIHTIFLGDRLPADQVLVASIVSQDASMTEYLVRCDPFASIFTMDRYDDHIVAAPTSIAQPGVSKDGTLGAERREDVGRELEQVLGHRQHHHHHREGDGLDSGPGRCDSVGLTWVTMWSSEGRYQWTAEDPGSHKRHTTCTAEKVERQEEAQDAAAEEEVPGTYDTEEKEVTLVVSCSWTEDGLEATAHPVDGAIGSNVETYTIPAASLTSKFFTAVSVSALPTADSEEAGELKKRASSASNCPSPPPTTSAVVTGGSPVSSGSSDAGSSSTTSDSAPTRSPNVARTVAVPTTDGPGMVIAAAAVGVGAFVFGWGLL